MRRHQALWIAIFTAPTVVLFLLIYIFPLGTLLVTSFTDWFGFEAPKFIGLQNFKGMFLEDPVFKSALVNTLVWGAIAAFVHVPFGVVIALVLVKKPFGWKFVRSVSMFPSIIPQAAMAVIYIFVFNPGAGLVNGFIRLLGVKDFYFNWYFDPRSAFLSVTLTWVFFAGVIVLITMAELSAVPRTLNEAARIDGATDLQIDLYINLPLLRNIIGTSVILAVTGVFKYFEVIYITTHGGPGSRTTNLGFMIYTEVMINNRYGYGNAVGLVLIVLGILVIITVSRFFKMYRTTT